MTPHLDKKILAALKSGPLLTRELADKLKEVSSRVYSVCRRLEELGSVESELIQGKKLLYCDNDQQVVTAAIYENCRKEKHTLKFFHINERVWSLA